MCGTVAFAKVVKPDPGDLHPSVFQFGPQGFGLARYPDDTARPDRQEITRQPVGILFGNGDDGGTDTAPQQFDESDMVVNECDDMGLGEQVILSDKKSNITMQSRLMIIPVTV